MGSVGTAFGPVVGLSLDLLVGMLAGALVLLLVGMAQQFKKRVWPAHGQ